ncbi:MAG: Ger(x)C family spore germination protein [Oscillospiraceae bacterium]|nr:Ger(x)C family spore germination protein [Oscillospiraceae bacterium]
MKRILAAIIFLAVVFSLCGCQDYRGLNSLTFVAGMAVDADEKDPEILVVNLEIVDTQSAAADSPMRSSLSEGQGRTLTEAIYNMNGKLHGELYFGNCELVVLGQKLAAKTDIGVLLEGLSRNARIRDDLVILVSQEKTAKEILDNPDSIVSFFVGANLMKKTPDTTGAKARRLYELGEMISRGTTDLALPAIAFANKEAGELRLGPLAIYSGEKMAGYMAKADMPFFLLATEKLKGGNYSFFFEDDGRGLPLYASLLLRKSEPRVNVTFDGERFTFYIDIKAEFSVSELSPGWENPGAPFFKELEERVEESLCHSVGDMAARVHGEFGADITGFSDALRNRDHRLWERVRDSWHDYLKDAVIKVSCEADITDAGLI